MSTMMIEGHKPEVLMSYDETPGAVKVVNGWIDDGHEVSVITGRPYSAYEPSRIWLDHHGIDRVETESQVSNMYRGYVLKRIIGHSEDDETFPTYVSSTGGYTTIGVNRMG